MKSRSYRVFVDGDMDIGSGGENVLAGSETFGEAPAGT